MKAILSKLSAAGARYGMTDVESFLTRREVAQIVERLPFMRHKAGKHVDIPLYREGTFTVYRTVTCYSLNGLWWTHQEPCDLPLILL